MLYHRTCMSLIYIGFEECFVPFLFRIKMLQENQLIDSCLIEYVMQMLPCHMRASMDAPVLKADVSVSLNKANERPLFVQAYTEKGRATCVILALIE